MIDYFVDHVDDAFVKKLVSVVIPMYNVERYIQRALSSVINQTYERYEVILIDDGSVDETSSVIAPYLKDQRLRYIYQENHGRSFARNRGIRESRGEYIAFLDADDEWLPDFLSISISTLCSDVEIGYSYSWGKKYNIISNEFIGEKKDKQKNGRVAKNNMLKELIGREKVIFDSIVVKRSTLKKVGGFDTRISVAEDWDFSMRLASCFDGYCIADTLVNIYLDFEHQNSYKRRDNFEMYLMVFDNLRKMNMSEENLDLLHQSLAIELYTRGIVLLTMGKVEESGCLLGQAYDTYPSIFLGKEFPLSFADQFLRFYDGNHEFADLIWNLSLSTEKTRGFSSVIKQKTIISNIYGLIVSRELRSPNIIIQSAIKAVMYDFRWLRRKKFLINFMKATYRFSTGQR